MKIPFCKYQGTGNDFILIDNREQIFDNQNNKRIEQLCHRRFGIGADGLILLENADNADFYMRYYNSDGNEASMCGNGGRCVVAFAKKLGIIDIQTTFLAPDGLHTATITEQGIALGMKDVSQIEQIGKDFFLNTGSPHYVRIIPSHKNFAIVLGLISGKEEHILHTKGGELTVKYTKTGEFFTNIVLAGKAELVFEGVL